MHVIFLRDIIDKIGEIIQKGGHPPMKHLNMLVWITQLGLSVAAPLGGCIWLSVWLRQRFDWGPWVVIVGVILGLVSAAEGLRSSIRAMERMTRDKKKEPPPVSFNDHE